MSTQNLPKFSKVQSVFSVRLLFDSFLSDFKYLGSIVSGFESIQFLENSIVAGATKIGGALGSACRSAVALPLSRTVDLHHSLVGPIALLNCVAWFPFLAKGGPWFSALCK